MWKSSLLRIGKIRVLPIRDIRGGCKNHSAPPRSQGDVQDILNSLRIHIESLQGVAIPRDLKGRKMKDRLGLRAGLSLTGRRPERLPGRTETASVAMTEERFRRLP